MKKYFGFLVAVVFYAIGMAGLFYMILSLGNLLPFTQIDGPVTKPFAAALTMNLLMLAAFGFIHSVMARKSFKAKWTQLVPRYLERSIYVLISGITVFGFIHFWQPMDGVLWQFEKGRIPFYVIYGISFVGWGTMVLSTFQTNHFDLFGLRQAYLNMVGQINKPLPFKSSILYKIVRHPLYMGMLMGIWFTPNMTVTHLVAALGITFYLLIGIQYEEKDLTEEFGSAYVEYRKKTPKLIPFTK